MYVPATPQPAAPLVPVGIAATDPTIVTPAQTELHVRGYQLNVLADHRASVTGRLLDDHRPIAADEVIALQVLGRRGWKTLARARTGANGRFRLSYIPRRLGSRWVRLRFAGNATELPSHRRLGRLNVFRLAEASWYGGGGSLACGGALTSSTLGVANKTLPCGTMITLRYDGRTIRVPVVDRGPYVAGREFDLTEATKDALDFGGVGEVWSTS
ncbi:MAG TPA: septal ring lytic transglycosylase RlpA family protein [Solirubrobacteraceae bacterium]